MLFQSSHGNIFYRILGPDQAITIAFVHGIFADHRMFEKIADDFFAGVSGYSVGYVRSWKINPAQQGF